MHLLLHDIFNSYIHFPKKLFWRAIVISIASRSTLILCIAPMASASSRPVAGADSDDQSVLDLIKPALQLLILESSFKFIVELKLTI